MQYLAMALPMIQTMKIALMPDFKTEALQIKHFFPARLSYLHAERGNSSNCFLLSRHYHIPSWDACTVYKNTRTSKVRNEYS